MRLDVSVTSAIWDQDQLTHLANRATKAVADTLALSENWEISLLACDDAHIAQLNADHRGKAKATNVLSWPSFDLAPDQPGAPPAALPQLTQYSDSLGDIAISAETCASESEQLARGFEDHVTHLLIHATLHLLGYDHETDADAARMEQLEVKILESLGVADPY